MGAGLAKAAARRSVEAGTVVGIATSLCTDGVVSEACFGLLDREREIPMQPDSVLRIHSLTKPVLGVAIMMLQERGLLSVQDPVRRWLPQLAGMWEEAGASAEGTPRAAELTIRHLLTHTAGLGYGIQGSDLEETYRAAGLLSPILSLQNPLSRTVELVSQLPTAFEPGIAWHYSIAFDVLGHLVELISGNTLAQFLEAQVFGPLGMADTGFGVPMSALSRFGPLYSAGADGAQVVDPVADSPYVHPEVVCSGGAGLVSTLRDYMRFAQILAYGGSVDGVRILEPDSVRTMTTNQLQGPEFPVRWDEGPDNNLGYGYGIGVSVGQPLKIGWIGASGCQMWIYPEQDLIALVLTQSMWDFTASDAFLAALLSPE